MNRIDPRTVGRRLLGSRTRPDRFTVLAVVLVLLTLVAALLTRTDAGRTPRSPSAISPLTDAAVVCPSADAEVRAVSFADASGDLAVRVGESEAEQVAVESRHPAVVAPAGAAVVVAGADAMAPGLVAGRFPGSAAAPCRPPVFDEWFTGVGAGAKHTSTLELINPDPGRALVNVDVLGASGAVEAPALRGIAVPPHGSVSVDLAAVVPRTDDLALHVQVLRGRASAAVRDSFDRLGGQGTGHDWLPSQQTPALSNLLLGVAGGSGRNVLVLANPGDADGRATLRFVDETATIAPEGVGDVVVPAHQVVQVKLGAVLAAAGTGKGERLVALSVDSTVPLTADALHFAGDDLVHAVPVAPLRGPGATLLPRVPGSPGGGPPAGGQRLLIAGATTSGAVTVNLWDERGRPLKDQRVAVTAGNGAIVDLPDDAALVAVSPSQTSVRAVVEITTTGKRGGTALIAVTEPQRTGRVPAVRPGLP